MFGWFPCELTSMNVIELKEKIKALDLKPQEKDVLSTEILVLLEKHKEVLKLIQRNHENKKKQNNEASSCQ